MQQVRWVHEAGLFSWSIVIRMTPDWFKEKMPNPWRTGGWFVVKEAAVRRMFRGEREIEFALSQRWIFIEHEAAKRCGLFDQAPTEGK